MVQKGFFCDRAAPEGAEQRVTKTRCQQPHGARATVVTAPSAPWLQWPGLPRAAPPSQAPRPPVRGAAAEMGSWPHSDFPQNSFVWEIGQIDSRPYNHETILVSFFKLRQKEHHRHRRSYPITAIYVSPPAGQPARLCIHFSGARAYPIPTLYQAYPVPR